MNAILPKRPLNEAFKRFQLLPALSPVLGEDGLTPGSVEEKARLAQRAAEARPPAQEYLEEALAE